MGTRKLRYELRCATNPPKEHYDLKNVHTLELVFDDGSRIIFNDIELNQVSIHNEDSMTEINISGRQYSCL